MLSLRALLASGSIAMLFSGCDSATDNSEVYCDHTVQFSGFVTASPSGNPVAGLEVQASYMASSGDWGIIHTVVSSTVTASDGSYRLGVPAWRARFFSVGPVVGWDDPNYAHPVTQVYTRTELCESVARTVDFVLIEIQAPE